MLQPLNSVRVDDGELFFDFFQSIVREPQQLKSVLQLLVHFLSVSVLYKSISVSDTQKSSSKESNDTQFQSREITLEPAVYISHMNRLTKMVCPSPSVIARHSTTLATKVEVNSKLPTQGFLLLLFLS